MPIYYLYRHIRHDLNVPFYVGISKKDEKITLRSEKLIYKRAYVPKERNDIWLGITKITDYDVEILFETQDKALIERKEQEFIELYGRIYDGSGTLANIIDGGFMCKGLPSRSRLKLAKPVYAYTAGGNFLFKIESVREAKRRLNVKTSISIAIEKRKGVTAKYQFFYDYQGELISPKNVTDKRTGRKILIKDFNTGKKIADYNSCLQAAIATAIPYGTIKSRLRSKKPLNGLLFYYQNELSNEPE